MTSRHRASEEISSARSTRRANQRHPAIIAKIVRPVPETGGGLFLWLDASERLLQFVETVASTCQQFVYELETLDTSGRPKFIRAWSSRYARHLVWPLDLFREAIS
jgi:hypothetical protein